VAPPYEVGEQQREPVRRVTDDQRGDQRPEQLGLARSGRTHDQAVRSHATRRGLLEIQQHPLPRRVEADRYPQQVLRGPRSPAQPRIQGRDVSDAQDPRQILPGGSGVPPVRRVGPAGREGPGQQRRVRDAELVEPAGHAAIPGRRVLVAGIMDAGVHRRIQGLEEIGAMPVAVRL
jgi:hypothetical protein